MSKPSSRTMIAAFRGTAVKRARELEAARISRVRLRQAVTQGTVERADRGLYRLAEADVGRHYSLALAAKRIPGGVVCLLSALSFYDLTTQNPHEVWMALRRSAWRPRSGHLPLRLVWFSGTALTGENRSRLLQVPEQDRPRCGIRSPTRGLARPPMHDG
jgi:predicted transcriptional regulator of viral defense system